LSEFKPEREGWVSVFRSSTDYEADMVRDRLDSGGVPAAVFSQRDHVLNLTIGELARVYVLVPREYEEKALEILEEQPLTEDELDQAASDSDASHESDQPGKEQLLDSGIERLRFSDPETPPDDLHS